MGANTVAMEAAREFLGRVHRLRNRIENKELRIETLRGMAMSTTGQITDMPRSDSPDLQRMETALCKAADLEQEIVRDREELEVARSEVAAALCELDDYREQQVLHDRYVECKTWAAISMDSGYHVRTLQRRHNTGVEHLAAIMARGVNDHE